VSSVLDASALLAMLQREPGWERVADVLHDACISAVNLSEVMAKLTEGAAGVDGARTTLELLAIPVIDFDGIQALETGALRPRTRAFGLSLGDRACLALALRRGDSALTADRAWSELDIEVEVALLR